VGKTHTEFATLLKMLIGYELVMDSYELVMFACEIPLILLCFFKTIYAVLLLMVGRVVVHLCDHNYRTTTSFCQGAHSASLWGKGQSKCKYAFGAQWYNGSYFCHSLSSGLYLFSNSATLSFALLNLGVNLYAVSPPNP